MDIAVPHLVSGGRLDVKADAERGRCGEAAHCQAGEHEEAPVRQGGVKSERLSCRRRSLGRLLWAPHILGGEMPGAPIKNFTCEFVFVSRSLDRLEGPGYAARRAELRRKAKEAARTRDRQAAAASQNETEESDATEEEATRESTTRRGRPRGGTKVAARIGERLRREIGRGGRPRVGDG